MSKVIVHHRAAKYLKKLPEPHKTRMKDALKQLEQTPLAYPGIKAMLGEWAGYHRIRVGSWRIIFWYDEAEDIVYVDHIGPRGDVYK